jgi:hypothetical protein
MSCTRRAQFLINLDRRPDRKLSATAVFKRCGLQVGRLSAPDAHFITEERGWRNKGARACALGHKMAWRAGKKALAEQVMVFEDEVVCAS